MDNYPNQEEQLAVALPVPNKPLLTVSEIAHFLNVSKSWIYQQTMHGSIPCLKVGKYLRFNPEEVLAFFKAQGTGYPQKDR